MNSQFFNRVCYLLPLAVCLVLLGCGSNSGPQMHPVRGTLTHNGEPIADMLICFEPVDANINPASEAVTDKEGKFDLKVGKTTGVKTGEYIVFVQDPMAIQGGKTSKDPTYLKVLKKYSDPKTSGIRITIDGAKKGYELKLD